VAAAHSLTDFLEACRSNKGSVQITVGAMSKARQDLSLDDEGDLKEYLASEERSFSFVNSKRWENFYASTGNTLMVDSYHFTEFGKKYYLSFGKNLVGKWMVKSLHRDDNELVHRPFEDIGKYFQGNGGSNED